MTGGVLNRELLAVLRAWQFNPAVPNGATIDVDAIIEIPVLFSTAAAR